LLAENIAGKFHRLQQQPRVSHTRH
jgi:hypothetical protein